MPSLGLSTTQCSTSQPSQAACSSTPMLQKRPAYDFTYETYEYNNVVYIRHGYGVLVAAAPTLEGAIDTAIQEFPDLSAVPREDIAICYETASGGNTVHWRISESAWLTSAKKFGPRTRLHVAVRGEDPMAGPSRSPQPVPSPPPYDETKAGTSSLAMKKSGNSISSLFKRF